MILPFTSRHSLSPSETRSLTTAQLREHYLIESIFLKDQITCTYTFHDRYMVGGAMPVSKNLLLEAPDILKANYFLERREMGIINVGGKGTIVVDNHEFVLDTKEALYLGRGSKKIEFKISQDPTRPPLFYYNSAPAHMEYPTKKISLDQAETVELGSSDKANHRTIRKLLINSVVKTCQLQMGLTELKPGSIWNTMPPHTHDRRMEVYLYFNIEPGQAVCHFMGEPTETRHLWVQNNQAAISPPWSIHSGAGTSNYSFIWGMAGENLDYGDMDVVQPNQLR
jgi:4-deoxy-L-threo-5-hexosulose-uronate ketol-isomerase